MILFGNFVWGDEPIRQPILVVRSVFFIVFGAAFFFFTVYKFVKLVQFKIFPLIFAITL